MTKTAANLLATIASTGRVTVSMTQTTRRRRLVVAGMREWSAGIDLVKMGAAKINGGVYKTKNHKNGNVVLQSYMNLIAT